MFKLIFYWKVLDNLLPFHIKLGIMKQFVKALTKDGRCFKYF